MNAVSSINAAQRLLILAPTGRDAPLVQSVLAANGVASVCCASMRAVCAELDLGADALLMAEEAISQAETSLREWLAHQPSWSDLPILVLARPGADSTAVARSMDQFGNVAVIERPMRITSIVSAARAAFRARQRQYQIREHIEERKRTEQALRDADRRKNDFLAMLAHELRNPLAPIRNSLEIVRMTSAPGSAAARVGPIMERQVNHMVRLVDDLLEIARITRGKIVLRKESLDLTAVARGAIETSRPLIDMKRHRLTADIPDDPVIVEGDFVRLTQVIANLLNNAAKYTDSGGAIRLTLRRDGDSALVSVTDSGLGIATDMLERIFEPFIQIGRESTNAQGGLGIGLTLAKTLIEMHGGTIAARSAGAGTGSEFVVRMPLGDANRARQAPARADGPVALKAQRILVVEDNHDAADSLGMLLKLLDAEVQIVGDGPSALEAFITHRPSVVLLDIGLPGMSGYEVARRIRLLADVQSVTIIALTGWGQEDDRRRSQDAGFDFHLTKPPNIHELENLLASLNARHTPAHPSAA